MRQQCNPVKLLTAQSQRINFQLVCFDISARSLMATTASIASAIDIDTTFTLDNMGRYLCNTLQEAIDSTSPSVGGRDFDVIIAGGGSFSSVIANGLFMRDPTRSRRILVLEQGPFRPPRARAESAFSGWWTEF